MIKVKVKDQMTNRDRIGVIIIVLFLFIGGLMYL